MWRNPGLSGIDFPSVSRCAALKAVLALAAGMVLAESPLRAEQATPASADADRVVAVRATGPITIDGLLDEPDWANAGLIPDLKQKRPRPGEATRYRTEVRLLVDRENLYVGFTCFDPEPERIALATMQRDVVDAYADDFVDVVIDTFGDRHSGYLFEVRATGAQSDGLISGPGQWSFDWDGVWDVKTRRGPEGWTAEIRIPTRTLHFKYGLTSWGLNVGRSVARDRIFLTWASPSLDTDFIDFAHSGRLEGIESLTQGVGVNLTPYVLGRRTDERLTPEGDPIEDEPTTVGRTGIDVTYSPTPGFSAVGTVNTDFAETEVDTLQINLTRFPLYFPEKRPFFLEGSNQFQFGLLLSDTFIPFYSRRVGLIGDENAVEVPIDYGAKVLGHTGRVGVAALGVHTGAVSFDPGTIEGSTADHAPATNLAAARVTCDLESDVRVGLIATRGNPDGVTDNALAGVDAVWHPTNLFHGKSFSAGGWAARTAGDLPAGDPNGYGFAVNYPNDFWNAYAFFNHFGDALEPALGFLPRPATRQYEIGNAIQPRPRRDGPFGWIRQAYYEAYYREVDALDGRLETRRLFTAPFNIETESGEHFETNWVPEYESISPTDPPFEVAPGVIIPPGDYHFTRYRAEAQSSESRPWRIGATVWWGDFYDGRLTQIENFVWLKTLGGHFQMKLDMQDDYGHLPEGDFIQRLWQLNNAFAISPRLLLFAYFQYESDTRSLGMNARLRYTLKPGSDLFFVWNRNWLSPVGESGVSLMPQADEFTLKLRVAFSK